MTEEINDPAVAAAQARVQRVLDDLSSIAETAPQEQVEAFTSAQRALAATLSDIDND